MSARSHIRGPRFALTNPEKCSACIKCVYGNGEHAEWCEKRNTLALSLEPVDGSGPSVRAPDERIDWSKCEGIEHVFYDDAGNVIFEEQLPAPQRAETPVQRETAERSPTC